MDLYGLAPWVGAGSFAQPYSASILFLSWVWRAKLIALGITCWDPVTGEMSTDARHLADMARLVNSQRTILNVGSCAFVSCDAPDLYRDVLADPRASDLPFRADSIEAFTAHARAEQRTLLDRLTSGLPSYDWTLPIDAAVAVIDSTRLGNAEAKRAHAYYSTILDPARVTADGPSELYDSSRGVWRADIARVAEILAIPDDLSSRIWQAELAYRLIVYTEAVVAFDEAGL